ncbi:MAG: lamin tail domain-containing protein [Bacteroidota bacterium]
MGNFNKKEVVFPVNSNSQRLLRIPITDDEKVEGRETFILTLTDVNNSDSSKISINKSFELTIFDDDTNSDLLLTEFLADPPAGIEGDANMDGERSASQDEFVEFWNSSDSNFDLTGMVIYDGNLLRHKIPDSTILQPNQRLVIFGGGTLPDDLGDDTIVQRASTGRLSLDNAGDRIILRDSLNEIVAFYEYGTEASNDQSMVLCPLEKGGSYVGHLSIVDSLSFSPDKLHTCELLIDVQEIYEKLVKIYPNPASYQLTVELPEDLPLEHGIRLLDLQGRVVATSTNRQILVQNFPKGLYFLRVATDRGVIVKKVFIE